MKEVQKDQQLWFVAKWKMNERQKTEELAVRVRGWGDHFWRVDFGEIIGRTTVGYATTDDCNNEQFLSIKSGCYNEHKCYNERGGILSAEKAHTSRDVSSLTALIWASVIIYVTVCKVQLSV
jgi:hypothetical protein